MDDESVPRRFAMAEALVRRLEPEECRDYLKLARVGRIAFNGPDGIELFPVNILAYDGEIFVRTDEDALLGRLLAEGPVAVALEADHFDDVYQQGWNVTVHGAAAVASATRVAELKAAGARPEPWAPGERDLITAITIDRLAGRRVRQGR